MSGSSGIGRCLTSRETGHSTPPYGRAPPTAPRDPMSLRLLAIAGALVVVTAAAAAQSSPAMPPPPTPDLVVAGRKLGNWILSNQLDSVVLNLAPNSNAD